MEGYKLLITLFLMILLIWRHVPISWVMLGCSALLAFMYHTGLIAFGKMLWRGMANPVTIELVIILMAIMMLEFLLRKEGYLQRMLAALQAIIPNPRFVMALLPSFIGLMPSAGGAVFSAPLVEHAAKGLAISPEQKSFVNFYYRHVTEYFLPIYPSILLIAQLSGIPVQKLILALIPYGVLAILLGIPVLKKIPRDRADGIVREESYEGPERKKMIRELVLSALPMLVVVLMVLALQAEVWLAVGLVILFLLIYHRYTPPKLLELFREIKIQTIILVFTVMIFKQVLEDTDAVAGLPLLLEHLPVPSYFVFIAINFLVAVMTGHMVALVGIGFPVALAAMGSSFDLPTAVLLFIAGFTGQMITPVHLCLTLTVNFFKADLNQVVKMLIGPEAVLLASAIAAYVLF
ncbi:DUF401 family protein [Candidatus Formimonas warabiya]|uniref:DUF401 family protein n=1 Tax=Formimonas warabiya TaxID=1761012 RepID=A0A3G1KY59_FORW1|nr:DUF401 family protein [Candidatus Formimonas warabiya]ATW27406.1 hypothetical protein DCMF_23995 [Candidatus Formimonas warabiya]